MEISNKTLAWLVVAAIAVSIFGTTVSLQRLSMSGNPISPYATYNDTGTASVTVSQSIVLRYAINSMDFGTGSVNTSGGYTSCVLAANGSSISTLGCTGFNSTLAAGNVFVLENAGTANLNVTLNFSKNATNFIGGNGTLLWFKYAMSNNESGSCTGTLNNTNWTEVIELTQIPICTNLSWVDPTDSLKIGINISIPNDAVAAAKSVSIIAQGTGI